MEIDVRVMHEDNSGNYSTYSIALYEAWSERADGLEFQRDLRDHTDPRAWTPPVFCTVNSRHDSVFGGILRATWYPYPSACSLLFTEEAVKSLGLSERELTLNIHLPQAEIDVVQPGLRRIFSFGDERSLPRLEGFE
ncbi:hypothetical protein [Micromonospora sp. IBSANI012]|uniref:hypothetical protein n=1 Tax=Micromonospora sp. IBSANI012 TaxID=3457761 RepID=UPI0040592D30